MALTEQLNPIDYIGITSDGSLEVREATRVLDDGEESSRFPSQLHRYVIHPGESTEGLDPRIVAVAEAVWTDAVIKAWENRPQIQVPPPGGVNGGGDTGDGGGAINLNPQGGPNRTVDWLTFMALFTPQEQAAVALSTDPHVAVFRMMAMGAGSLNLDDERVGQGLHALEAAGLIKEGRAQQVIDREQPGPVAPGGGGQ